MCWVGEGVKFFWNDCSVCWARRERHPPSSPQPWGRGCWGNSSNFPLGSLRLCRHHSLVLEAGIRAVWDKCCWSHSSHYCHTYLSCSCMSWKSVSPLVASYQGFWTPLLVNTALILSNVMALGIIILSQEEMVCSLLLTQVAPLNHRCRHKCPPAPNLHDSSTIIILLFICIGQATHSQWQMDSF